MKRLLLIIGILLPMMMQGVTVRNTLTKSRLTSFISDCRCYEGAEVVQLGRLATSALKGAVRISGIGDPDVREALSLIKGIKSMSIFDYDDCSDADKAFITSRLDKILADGEILMEAKDGADKMRIYGVVDEGGDTVRDFILYAPHDCALICIFGSISTKKAIHIVDND